MKVVLLIDSLGSGGSQRQLCFLAVLLKKGGMDVTVLTYRSPDFFLPVLRAAGIEHVCLPDDSLPRRVFRVRQALRRGDQDAVLAFLEFPSLYAELATIPRRSWGLVVSERSAAPASRQPRRQRWLRTFHHLADFVTTNAHTNRLLIERSVPGLPGRVVTVYNAVDLQAFSPAASAAAADLGCLRLAVVASIRALKNPLGFVQAVAIARAESPSLDLQLRWYGRPPSPSDPAADREAFDAVCRFIGEHDLEDHVSFCPPLADIAGVYHRADALALPSFFEGLPNVVCEAMACGRPVLMSNVADAGNLVNNGQNGFLFDPASPQDMARAILEFAALGVQEREIMGRKSREMAERMFDPATVAGRYADLLSAAAARRRTAMEHWIPEVPDSAYRSLT